MTDWQAVFADPYYSKYTVNFYSQLVPQNFRNIAPIRHAAVHRLTTSNYWIRNTALPSAMLVAWATGDDVAHGILVNLEKAMNGGKWLSILIVLFQHYHSKEAESNMREHR